VPEDYSQNQKLTAILIVLGDLMRMLADVKYELQQLKTTGLTLQEQSVIAKQIMVNVDRLAAAGKALNALGQTPLPLTSQPD
jgi:hypothetical protein